MPIWCYDWIRNQDTLKDDGIVLSWDRYKGWCGPDDPGDWHASGFDPVTKEGTDFGWWRYDGPLPPISEDHQQDIDRRTEAYRTSDVYDPDYRPRRNIAFASREESEERLRRHLAGDHTPSPTPAGWVKSEAGWITEVAQE